MIKTITFAICHFTVAFSVAYLLTGSFGMGSHPRPSRRSPARGYRRPWRLAAPALSVARDAADPAWCRQAAAGRWCRMSAFPTACAGGGRWRFWQPGPACLLPAA